MRLAPIDEIAQTPDVIVFDDLVHEGVVGSPESNFNEMRLFTRPGYAVLLLSTTAGVHALRVDPSGKLEPIGIGGN